MQTELSKLQHPLLSRRTTIQAGALGLLGLGMNHVQQLQAVTRTESTAASGAATPNDHLTSITTETVTPIVTAAIDVLARAGVSKNQLEQVTVRVGDLPGSRLAEAFANTITIDVDAAGHGWFIDITPYANEEFDRIGTAGFTAAGDSAAAGHMDLLSVVMHEFGHVLGLDDHTDIQSDDLMNGWIDTGVRRLPTEGEIATSLGGI